MPIGGRYCNSIACIRGGTTSSGNRQRGGYMKELLDSEQAAAYLRLARQTLARRRCEGTSPPFFKVGRQVLYDRHDLDVFLDERCRLSTSDRGAARNEHQATD